MHNTIEVLYIDCLPMGGEQVITTAVLQQMEANAVEVSRYYPATSTLQNSAVSKELSIFFGLISMLFNRRLFRNTYSKKVLYASHSFITLFVPLLRRTHRIDEFWFHYHGTKVSKFTAQYPNPIKRNTVLIIHRAINAIHQLCEHLAEKYANTYVSPTKKARSSHLISQRDIVLPSFVDTRIFKPIPYQRLIHTSLVIGYIGRIAYEKGIFTLLEGCKLEKESIRNCLITVQNGYNEYLLRQVEAYRKYYSITALTNPTRQEIARNFVRVDAVFLPSESEVFPIAMLESLALGVPFFAPDVGNCKEILNSIHKNLLLDSISPQEVAKKIRWLNSLTVTGRNMLAQRCITVAQRYNHTEFSKIIETELLA